MTYMHINWQAKAERDEAELSYTESQSILKVLQSTCLELRIESEHLQMALSIVEPKVHVLQAMFSGVYTFSDIVACVLVLSRC